MSKCMPWYIDCNYIWFFLLNIQGLNFENQAIKSKLCFRSTTIKPYSDMQDIAGEAEMNS